VRKIILSIKILYLPSIKLNNFKLYIMKKFYSLLAAVAITANVVAQTKTITIDVASIGGTAVLGSNNYNSGAEKTWSTGGISLGGKQLLPIQPTALPAVTLQELTFRHKLTMVLSTTR
jgi:hypothetical protein